MKNTHHRTNKDSILMDFSHDIKSLFCEGYDNKTKENVNAVIDLVFFIRKPFKDWRMQYHNIYKWFKDEFGDQFTYCAYGEGKWLKATERQLTKTLTWKEDDKIMEGPVLSFNAHSGLGEDAYWSPKPPAFEFFQDQGIKLNAHAHIKLSFPLNYSSENILKFCKKHLKDLPIHSGYSGYSVLCDENDVYNQWWTPQFINILRKYSGLCHPDAGRIGTWAKDKLAIVNWLTFLGEDLLKRMGGAEKLNKDLFKEFICHDLGSSVCVQAGKVPGLGKEDANSLPLYRKLGNYLNPLRADDNMMMGMGVAGVQSSKEELDWYLRFFT